MRADEMDLCGQYEFLRMLPRAERRRIVWSWQAENGTVLQIPGNNLQSAVGCITELTNISTAALTTLVAIILICKYRCSADTG